MGGTTEFEGRVEVCNGGAWGTVCDDLWDITDGNVVCAQLEYGIGLFDFQHVISMDSFLTATSAPCCAAYGRGTGSIVLDNVGCNGTETNLFDCTNSGLNVHNCGHSEDAGVICLGEQNKNVCLPKI